MAGIKPWAVSTQNRMNRVIRPDSSIIPETLSSRKTILELCCSEAQNFFLKAESYCDVNLPSYFAFDKLIKAVHSVLVGESLSDLSNSCPQNHDDVNYTIFNNKDGKYAWRPLQLIHPALYVSLVHQITKEANWKMITDRFKEFSADQKIRCLSMPVVSQSDEKDKAEQISHWWQEVEQQSIQLALDYDYALKTDITDCYGAIYTHSIAWALHSKTKAKAKEYRNCSKLIGNQIDKHIQAMHNGQTNGIPQGSALMDFIVEMILGYADSNLSEKINDAKITDYLILRYRDDYRIFVNNQMDGEKILKLLTEVMISLGLKLNSLKTKFSNEVIRASVKSDKIAWLIRKKSEKNLQNHLLIIHDHARHFPNAGSLAVALQDYYKRLSAVEKLSENPSPLISIIVDIAYKNPRTYAICAAILSKLMRSVNESDRKDFINKIRIKFEKIPNTGHMEIWLQRISHPIDTSIKYAEPLCKLVSKETVKIWNIDWISSNELKNAVDASKIIDGDRLAGASPVVPSEEFELFISKSLEGYNS